MAASGGGAGRALVGLEAQRALEGLENPNLGRGGREEQAKSQITHSVL